MINYNISPENSPDIFKETCDKIEELLPDFLKLNILIDVDGSCIQEYKKNSLRVLVFDDYDVGAVYIQSDIDLDSYFSDYREA